MQGYERLNKSAPDVQVRGTLVFGGSSMVEHLPVKK
jgi:hypothetical protein